VGFAVCNATDVARAASDVIMTKPGLSAITDGIISSRIAFARILSYAYYRIVTTLHNLIFLSLAILILDFYVPSIVVVLIALMNNFLILSIAFDNQIPSSKPSKLHIPTLFISCIILGIVQTLSSFLLYDVGLNTWNLDTDQLYTLIYLQICVGGHFVVFSTRVEGAWCTSLPSTELMCSSLITMFVATLQCVYGVLVSSVSWTVAGWTWLYCFVVFLFLDSVKQMCQLYQNHTRKVESIQRQSSLKF